MSVSTLLSTPRSAIMATFAAFGAVVGTVSGSAPQLIAQHGLDNATYGLGITLMSAATVGSMGLSGTLARRFSHRALLLAVLPVLLSSLWLLLSHGSVTEFFLFAIMYGVTTGVTDVIMNAEAGAIEHALGKRIISSSMAWVRSSSRSSRSFRAFCRHSTARIFR